MQRLTDGVYAFSQEIDADGGSRAFHPSAVETDRGLLLFDAIQARDIPVVMGGTVVVIAAGVLGNLLQDLSYELLDPRVDTGRRVYQSDPESHPDPPGGGLDRSGGDRLTCSDR